MKKKRQFNLICAFLLVNSNFCCSTWAADSEERVDWEEEKNLLSGKHLHVLLSLVQVYLHIFILLFFKFNLFVALFKGIAAVFDNRTKFNWSRR